jgi:serine/threonine protein kinase
LNLNRNVAIKILRREKANDINTRRFLREAEINGSLSGSPYICTVYDFGRTRGGTLFIVMELLKGRAMNELLDERIQSKEPFTMLEVIHIISPVLRGLQAAHQHKPSVVHRDLKPDNSKQIKGKHLMHHLETRI